MNKEDIFEIIKSNVIKILGSGRLPEEITMEKRLDNLGADSIDRADIMVMTIEDVGVKMPLVELGRAKTIRDIVDTLHRKIMSDLDFSEKN